MKVLIPSPLYSYTAGQKDVEAAGATLTDLLTDLDRQFPGLRFRVVDEQDRLRPHMRFFLNGEQVFDLKTPLKPTDAVQIVQALSGG
jgi:molybdopterin converting factor small subunit